ncbi:uncharacterized protein LOC122382272 isoform X1 [Amphibalanus amphitrite]|nr:uncharacterized protein LOC122382272 isoform X1 [Amphibalanus amphitrite]XP_043223325.1 uncharacterized protein LOC122382272 isoform X1 [Amphibalanus amphitrite]XP_043223326.1 uncharacterized protein LOC122382272 isoform X1 [Amphibalanus amphitrite]XP_043223327.1 uncharacterized protein LOC122382272 isoform X1 [Amphibalanus amphitrite]XP_043223328.1 uncharacterized protein LOC122382272 isoform X1 [Amphibalanus amphitrite]
MVLAEYLQCGICFEPYTADSRLPKFLQCSGGIQHTYCLQCLRRLTVGGMIRCPCCGDLTSLGDRPADSLKNNIYLLPQIEAAAAARKQNGLEMFCRTCSAVAADQCGEHDLLKMSELREALRQLAERGAADMETVRQRRADAVTLFKEAHTVLVSVAESVRFTIEDYEMNAQLDDNIVGELERRREAADALPSDQLVDSYRFTEQHVADAHAALRETAPLAEQSAALLAASVALSAPGLSQTFAVGEWLHSGDLMKALLAASVVVYALDHVTAGEQEAGAAAEQCHKVGDTKPAAETKSFTYTNGLVANSNSKPSGKSLPSANGKSADKSSKPNEIPVTKAPLTAPAVRISSSSSTANGTATAKASDSAKLAKAASTNDKTAGAAAAPATKTVTPSNGMVGGAKLSAAAIKAATSSTAAASKPATASVTAAKPKPAPSFSSMVKSTSPAAPAPAADASRTSVQRPLRGTNPRYSLRVTDGAAITDVIVELRPDMAPIMCKNFVTLCERGLLDNSRFHFAVHSDYLLGGRVDDDEGFSPLAKEPEKFVMADQCPLQDESGAIRMKGMGTVTGPNGEKRGLIGSQFMMWVSETRDYRQYQYTLVFGFIRQGLEFVRAITCMERAAIWRHARLLSTKPYRQ